MRSISTLMVPALLLAVLTFTGCDSKANRESVTENVFLITYDGLRWQELFQGADSLLLRTEEYAGDTAALIEEFWAESEEERRDKLLPFFWNTIATQGQLIGNRELGVMVNCTNQMWFSYPGYNEILSGFADDENITSNDKIPNSNITILEYLNKQEEFAGKVAAFASWDVFPYIINEERSGVPVNAGFESASGMGLSDRESFLNELQKQIPSPWATVRLDAFTHHYAVEYIKSNKPRLVYIAYGETDDFAHDGEFDQYLRSARRTDAFISDLWDMVQSMEEYRGKTTFIITTDHGRGTVPIEHWKHHGYPDVVGAGEIWIAMIGPDIEPMGVLSGEMQFYQNQVAATVAYILGEDFSNGGKAGEPLSTVIREVN